MKYTIADQYLTNLRKKAERIAKKCAALGQPFTFEVGEATTITYVQTVGDGFSITRHFPAHEVEVSGIARINGWSFIGRIEHLAKGNLLQNAPDMSIPETYRQAEPYCEHCHTRHQRKETFVIRNEAGEYKQVGRNCLMLYTNGLDAEACAEYASIAYMLEQHNGKCEAGWDVYGDKIEWLVAVCYHHISEIGYDREKLLPRIDDSLWKCQMDTSIRPLYAYEKYKAQVDEIIASARAIPDTATDYLANVKVVMADGVVMSKHRILVASYVAGYIKRKMREQADAKKTVSQHIGQVGERITFKVKVVDGKAYRILYTKSVQVGYNRYSETYVIEFIDTDGNVIVWSTSSPTFVEMDQYILTEGATEFTFKATVKKHDEYKGVKQTVVQRAKIIEVK